jgi:hypothetical protein
MSAGSLRGNFPPVDRSMNLSVLPFGEVFSIICFPLVRNRVRTTGHARANYLLLILNFLA